MKLQHLIEVKYAGGPPSWTSDIKGRSWTKELNQFIRTNKKILDEVYEVLKLSFIFFYEMSIDYMDQQPEEYEDEERDPQGIALSWHEGWSSIVQDTGDESPAYQAAVKHLEGPDFDDTISYMNDFIITHARHIVNEN